jgi:hypothetical protein
MKKDSQSYRIISKKEKEVRSQKTSYFGINKRYLFLILDLGLLFSFILIFSTGLLKLLDIYGYVFYPLGFLVNISILHDWSSLIFGIMASLHFILHLKWFGQKIKRIFRLKKEIKPNRSRNRGKRQVKLILNLSIAISSLILLITGILKLPGVLNELGWYPHYSLNVTLLHDWSGFIFGWLILSHLFIHLRWIAATTRKVWHNLKYGKLIMIFSVLFVLAFPMVPMGINMASPEGPKTEGISIQLIGRFYFNPEDIDTVRPDIFREAHFSIFDILVHLDKLGEIQMQYHFRADLNTYIIDSINGMQNWWYFAYYDGGWKEENVFRIDHYPFKPNMAITLFQKSSGLQEIYSTYIQENNRLINNSGAVIIPDVYIVGSNGVEMLYHDIEVSAHNLRNDIFQDGVITAIDVILSMGDQGILTYDLKWYDSIGTAVTRSFWIHAINGDVSYGRCGFVYEEGDNDFIQNRNHIHIPSDTRVINSPEYIAYFWICI